MEFRAAWNMLVVILFLQESLTGRVHNISGYPLRVSLVRRLIFSPDIVIRTKRINFKSPASWNSPYHFWNQYFQRLSLFLWYSIEGLVAASFYEKVKSDASHYYIYGFSPAALSLNHSSPLTCWRVYPFDLPSINNYFFSWINEGPVYVVTKAIL